MGEIARFVVAEPLARAIAAIQIASVRWRSYLPQTTEISPHRPCVRCAAIRIARLAFVRLRFVPRGIAEWFARVDRVRWTLAIGDWRFGPSKFQAPIKLAQPFPAPELRTRILRTRGCFWDSAYTEIIPIPEGPTIKKIRDFERDWKFSSENEIFERATHSGPIFCGEFETSRLKFSSEIKNFDRDWLNFERDWIFSIVGPCLWVCEENIRVGS